jgi:hypothetical protein
MTRTLMEWLDSTPLLFGGLMIFGASFLYAAIRRRPDNILLRVFVMLGSAVAAAGFIIRLIRK